MSQTLWCRPVSKQHSLPEALRDAMLSCLKDRGGSCCWGTEQGDRRYLEGLRDAGVEGAQALLDVLFTHPAVELWLE